MKSEHRHELKSNELAEWLGNLPQWFKDNLGSIIIIVVAIVVFAGFFGWRYYSKNVVQSGEKELFTNMIDNIEGTKAQIINQQMSGQSSDMSYILLTRADEIEKFATSVDNKNMAALAYIKGADSIRSELHYSRESISKEYLNEKIGQAKTIYTQAIDKNPSNHTIGALATFGLGLCSEEIGDFNDARKVYQGIVEDDNFKGTVVANKAKLRLATMDDYEQPIEFKPAPPPVVVEPNAPVQPLLETIPVEPNQPTGSNIPSDINAPIGTNNVIEESEANLPANIVLPTDENSLNNLGVISETNLPDDTNVE